MEKLFTHIKTEPENQEQNHQTIPSTNNKKTKTENTTEINFFSNESDSSKKQKRKINNLPLVKSKTTINNDNQNFLNDYYNQQSQKIPENSNFINIDVFLGNDIHREINFDILSEEFPNFSNSKISNKPYGNIISYAANTNQGIIRDYNEDRVSIVINLNKPQNYKKNHWEKISYFAIFDGHGGNKCAEFLRNNLLFYIYNNIFYPENILEAIKTGIAQAEIEYLTNYSIDINSNNQEIISDNSGSCALFLLLIKNKIYIANVGDSRCIISMNNGLIQKDVTRDHKPNYPYEKERINANGGEIYQTQTNIPEGEIMSGKILLGPYRVIPGRLSVSRTIGDAEAKLKKFGGNKNVVICKPDIFCFDLEKDDIDFVILGCDGIYDNLSSKDIFKCVNMVIDKNKNINMDNDEDKVNIHKSCGFIVDFILKAAMCRKSLDNVTCVMVAFKDMIKVHDTINNSKNNFDKRILKINDNKKKTVLPSISQCNINYNRKNFVKEVRRGKSENDKNTKEESNTVNNTINSNINNNHSVNTSINHTINKIIIKRNNSNNIISKKRKIKLALLNKNNIEMETNNNNEKDIDYNNRYNNKFYMGNNNLNYSKINQQYVPKNIFNTYTKIQNPNFYNNTSNNDYSKINNNYKNSLNSHRVVVKNNLKNKIFLHNLKNQINDNGIKKIKNTLERNNFYEYEYETNMKNEQLEKYKMMYDNSEKNLLEKKEESTSLEKKLLKRNDRNKNVRIHKRDRIPRKDIIDCKDKQIKSYRGDM